MAKKRIHEIAKEQGLSSKDVLDKLQAAGLDVKAAASTVEEADALRAIGGATTGNGAPAPGSKPAAADGGAATGTPPAGRRQPARSPEGRGAPVRPPEGRGQPVRPPAGRGQPVRPGQAPSGRGTPARAPQQGGQDRGAP